MLNVFGANTINILNANSITWRGIFESSVAARKATIFSLTTSEADLQAGLDQLLACAGEENTNVYKILMFSEKKPDNEIIMKVTTPTYRSLVNNTNYGGKIPGLALYKNTRAAATLSNYSAELTAAVDAL